MLARLQIKNFKRFDDVDIELGKSVVLIGPNNSGKTTVLQALVLWNIGLKKWNEKRKGKPSPEKRSGVTINRNDLISIPVPVANLLWRNLHMRNIRRINGNMQTQNVRIDIVVEGISNGREWQCGFEFDYANEESFYCRPLQINENPLQRMPVPDEAGSIKIAFLPPMSGLAAIEPKWEQGRINVLLGEGQTAQVLRNLCYQLFEKSEDKLEWNDLIKHIENLFGVTLHPPRFNVERGEITMSYKEDSIELDLSSSGRGLQQTLLLLAYLYANPQTVLLLDEPDAHLEVLRQRQIYELITNIATEKKSQIIAASHSEVVLNEAADRDIVIAFVGKPHRIYDRGSQVLKALKEIGFDQYYQAEQKGWVLYLEGSTDLAILKAFTSLLNHPAKNVFDERPFVCYVGNQPQKARDHFFGLQVAKKDLVGIALFDRSDKELKKDPSLIELMWNRKEFENYLCMEEVLIAFARSGQTEDIFGMAEADDREKVMRETILDITTALQKLNRPSPWSPDTKVTDEFLDPLFKEYFNKLKLADYLWKTNYHILVQFVPKEKVDPEIIEKLDTIVTVAEKAKPRIN